MSITENLKTPNTLNWCPGCGNFAIWTAFLQAAKAEKWDATNTVAFAGIGCHGHISNFLEFSTFEGLHGRSLPVASGMKMANSKLNIFIFSGDGDCLSEGGNHFIHTCRRNHDITLVLHDNAIYGLTTGQTSPRSPHGFKSKSTPAGNFEEPLSPLSLAIASGATFVARAYSGDIETLQNIFVQANHHKGFAIVDVLQPCVTFNSMYTHNFYQKNIYYLDKQHDKTDKAAAFAKSLEWDLGKIPVGIFYQVQKPTYEEQITQTKDTTLIDLKESKRDISDLLEHFR